MYIYINGWIFSKKMFLVRTFVVISCFLMWVPFYFTEVDCSVLFFFTFVICSCVVHPIIVLKLLLFVFCAWLHDSLHSLRAFVYGFHEHGT